MLQVALIVHWVAIDEHYYIKTSLGSNGVLKRYLSCTHCGRMLLKYNISQENVGIQWNEFDLCRVATRPPCISSFLASSQSVSEMSHPTPTTKWFSLLSWCYRDVSLGSQKIWQAKTILARQKTNIIAYYFFFLLYQWPFGSLKRRVGKMFFSQFSSAALRIKNL